jgi:hypothetical protein
MIDMTIDVLNPRFRVSHCRATLYEYLNMDHSFHTLPRSLVSLAPYCEHYTSELDERRVLLLDEMLDGKFACLWNADKRDKKGRGILTKSPPIRVGQKNRGKLETKTTLLNNTKTKDG